MASNRKRALLCLVVTLALGSWVWFHFRGFNLEKARLEVQDRDIFVITLDTVRYDHLGCYGYERDTTPAIDRLAAEGVRFETAYSVTPLTLPSHCTIFTGRDPPRHGVRNNGTYRLPKAANTLAEVMAKSGRRTAAFISAFVLNADYGLNQGFQVYDDDLSEEHQIRTSYMHSRRAHQTIERAQRWIKQYQPDERLFLWLHFFDPHGPYQPLPTLRNKFGPSPRDRYDAEIRAVDDVIGRFRKQVEAGGRTPIWVILSDHGEGFFDHGEGAHGIFLYEEATRMALILSGKGVFAPQVSKTVARQTDIFPTLLDLCGVPIPAGLDGRSLLESLAGETENRQVYLESLVPFEDYGWSPLFGIVRNGWKYIEAPKPEIYDLAADPAEKRNLIHSERSRAKAMAAALRELSNRQTGRVERLTPDWKSHMNLVSLGYASGGGLPKEGEPLPDPKDVIDITLKLGAAREFFDRKSPDFSPLQSIKILENVLERNPGNGEAIRLLAHESLRLATEPTDPNRKLYLSAARRGFNLMAKRDPDAPDRDYGYGLIAYFEDKRTEAQRYFEKVSQTHPDHVESVVQLAKMAHQDKQWDRAKSLAEKVLKRDPTNYDAFFVGAAATSASGEIDKAANLYRKALAHCRDSYERDLIRFFLAQYHHRAGEFREALEFYQKIQTRGISKQHNIDALEAECRAALKGQ